MTSNFLPPFRANGTAAAPASKSDLHRLLILASLRNKQTKVCNLNLCDDVQATIGCLKELGANIEIKNNTALVSPLGFPRRGEAVERSETDEGPAYMPQEEITTSSAAAAAPSPEGKARSCSSFASADALSPRRGEGKEIILSFPSGEAARQSETDEASHGSLVQRELPAQPTEGLSSPPCGKECADEERVPLLDARESGSTLRFLLPVACAIYPHVRFTARGSLLKRPIGGIIACMKRHGVSFSSDTLPFETHGLLQTGEYEIDASLSSQYASGLLMASVITGGKVKITGKAASAPYIALTARRIDEFRSDKNVFTAEGDWSAAAALLCLPGEVTVTGLAPDSPQADRAISDALQKSDAEIVWNGSSVTVRNTNPKPFSFDVTDCPDLAPCLAVLMAAGASPRPMASEATSTLTGCRRLIYKECNRADAIVNMINDLGGSASFDGNIIYIRGPLTGGKVKTCSDHRIAMAGCVAAAWSESGAQIDDTDCVNKSCPDFWKLIADLRS